MVKSNLVQPKLTPEVRIDEANGETKIMIIQNMAYDQQIQKQEIEKSNIVNP